MDFLKAQSLLVSNKNNKKKKKNAFNVTLLRAKLVLDTAQRQFVRLVVINLDKPVSAM